MPRIKDMKRGVIAMWREISPTMQPKSLRLKENQLDLLDRRFGGRRMHEITVQDVVAYAKGREAAGANRKTMMIELRALEDAYIVAQMEPNVAAEALNLIRKKARPASRHRTNPDYARRSGYNITGKLPPDRRPRKAIKQATEPPTVHDLEDMAFGRTATLVCNNTRVPLEGENTASVLLDAAVEMERMAKRGHKTFIVLFDEPVPRRGGSSG